LVRGELLMNAARRVINGFFTDQPTAADNSFLLHPDKDSHGAVLSSGPVTVTLESGADVRVGDAVRGTYLFDHVTVANGRVYTSDLVVSTNTPFVDGSSTWVTGDLAAPAVNVAKISFASGLNGPVIVGQAGAVSDPEGLIEVYARNESRTQTPPAFTAGSSFS